MAVDFANISGDNFIVWSHTDKNFLKALQRTSLLSVSDDYHIHGRNFKLLQNIYKNFNFVFAYSQMFQCRFHVGYDMCEDYKDTL